MTTQEIGPEDASWQLFATLHRLLSRLAGHLPDELTTHLRALLGEGDVALLPDTVAGSAATLKLPLTADELLALRSLSAALAPGSPGPAGADQVLVAANPPASGHTFTPERVTISASVPTASVDGASGVADELTDQLMTDAIAEAGGALRMWRAWRAGPESVARRVYLVEVSPGVPAWELVADLQRQLEQWGEQWPQVEVIWSGEEPAVYQRAIRTGGTMLWQRP